MKLSGKEYKRVVIKIGSSLLFAQQNHLGDFVYPMSGIAREISHLVKGGLEVIVVSSGAVAAGMSALKMSSRPKDLSSLQATAAIGQHLLMSKYQNFFQRQGLNCAQVLLTWEDFDDRKRYLNAKNTLSKLMEFKSIPIINENDTVSTDEIKFGDNDRLSALVTTLINADLLIILSDVDGLMDKDKNVIKVVDEITPKIKALACPTKQRICVGGMVTKLEAAKIVADSGVPCVIANGRKKEIILSVLGGSTCDSGTLFLPKKGYLAAKERWMAFSSKPKGKIMVDDGAREALLKKKSLLCVGVAALDGDFQAGDIVSVVDSKNSEFARGKARVSSKQLDKVKGRRFEKEIIHRDNIVIL